MSLLKAIKAQLGLSNTPANNFTITAEADNGTLKLARGNAGATTQDILTVDAAGNITSPSGCIGYSTGAGGAVTQTTSKATEVILNAPSGRITMNAGLLNAGASVAFQLTNSLINIHDLVLAQRSSGGSGGAYSVIVDSISPGSCVIILKNISASNLSEAVVITFAIIKGASE